MHYVYKRAVLTAGSGFFLNIAAGWFALLFVYSGYIDLLIKSLSIIISYTISVELKKKSYEL